MERSFFLVGFIIITLVMLPINAFAKITLDFIDLSEAVLMVSDDSLISSTSKQMLVEEIYKRTGVTLSATKTISNSKKPTIVLCKLDTAPKKLQLHVAAMNVPRKSDGFGISIDTTGIAPIIVLASFDERGILFAAGKLLLNLKMTPKRIELPSDFQISTAPRYPHRGHQIGYRDLSHSYDAWTPETYEQYMREMAMFGANAFETTSFGEPDQFTGPNAKVTYGEMAKGWSRICAEYGYDFWLFTTAIGGEGHSPEDIKDELESRLKLIRDLPALDHIYLTGGDGGSSHRRPDLMFEETAQFAQKAREINPDLGIWVSNQGFGPELNNWFFDYLQREQPDWVTGVVYGAWSRILLDEQRARTPEKYPIRRYSDIGHCLRSQYPVPGWDRAFARTLGREPYAPRPKGHANIHNRFAQYADGFVTYSDGIGDDVNKVVWTALGWDPERSLDDIMLEYARFHFGWDIAEKVREGLYRLEEHFEGSLADNREVKNTYRLWKELEDNADEQLLNNWRFQGCLLRAYYDYYTQLRLIKANDLELRATSKLKEAHTIGVEKAINKARLILEQSDQNDFTYALRKRIVDLGEELYKSIGAQLDVANYHATSDERGAVLDFLDTPLNNKAWLLDEMNAIIEGRFTASMPESYNGAVIRLARIDRVVHWEDPGPGGYYDDLGCTWKQPNLIRPKSMWEDPGGITTPREAYTRKIGTNHRLSWSDTIDGLFSTPIILQYENLDTKASYRIRVTYLGRYQATVKLVADNIYEIHGAYGNTLDGVRYTPGYRDNAAVLNPTEDNQHPVIMPLEFVIPREATLDGKLTLQWERQTGRGIQIAEVWLIKSES